MLHIKNLHKSYGAFEVLRGLEMNVNTGDIYGFLGKNGCGKTGKRLCVSGEGMACRRCCGIEPGDAGPYCLCESARHG